MISRERLYTAARSVGFKLDTTSAEFTLSLISKKNIVKKNTSCPNLIHHNWFGPPLLHADRNVLELNLKRVAPLGGPWKFIMWLSPNFSSSSEVFVENSEYISSLSERYNIDHRNIEDDSHPPEVLTILSSLWRDTQALRQLRDKDSRFRVCFDERQALKWCVTEWMCSLPFVCLYA